MAPVFARSGSPITLDNLATIVQVCFWLTLGVIGILTYRQASRTVFHPFRNEVFKRQLDLADEIMRLVTATPPLWDHSFSVFAVDDVIAENLLEALENESVRRGYLDREQIDQLDLPRFDAVDETEHINVIPYAAPLWPAELHATYSPLTDDSEVEVGSWAVAIPARCHNAQSKLAFILQDPLLHPAWREPLKALDDEIDTAISIIGEEVGRVADRLPYHRGDSPEFLTSFFAGNHNRCLDALHAGGVDLERRRLDVIGAIRATLATDAGWGFERHQ